MLYVYRFKRIARLKQKATLTRINVIRKDCRKMAEILPIRRKHYPNNGEFWKSFLVWRKFYTRADFLIGKKRWAELFSSHWKMPILPGVGSLCYNTGSRIENTELPLHGWREFVGLLYLLYGDCHDGHRNTMKLKRDVRVRKKSKTDSSSFSRRYDWNNLKKGRFSTLNYTDFLVDFTLVFRFYTTIKS